MQISSRFTIALHMFMCIHIFEKDHKITSDFLAESIHVNPVVIRRLLSQLKAAGLLSVQRGSGGASIAKPLSQITFLDVYRAVERPQSAGRPPGADSGRHGAGDGRDDVGERAEGYGNVHRGGQPEVREKLRLSFCF